MAFGLDLQQARNARTACSINAGNWYNECQRQASDLYTNCQAWLSDGSGIYWSCMSFYYQFAESCELGWSQMSAECASMDWGIQLLEQDLARCLECCANPACSGGEEDYLAFGFLRIQMPCGFQMQIKRFGIGIYPELNRFSVQLFSLSERKEK
ncbi:MAG: hypothetical protein FJW36_00190 [Acidobacteria bacterium]|nr:hypothetical protein [Acidobacteriota bacterium]